jgi:hypothetical protein
MKKNVWVVTFHFGRNHTQVLRFDNKIAAESAVRIAVFNNEDCINCSIYRQEETVEEEKESRVRFNLQKG